MNAKNIETQKAIQEYGLESLAKLQSLMDDKLHSVSLWHYTEDGVTIYDTNEVREATGKEKYHNRDRVDIFIDGQSWYSSEDTSNVFAVTEIICRSFSFALASKNDIHPLANN